MINNLHLDDKEIANFIFALLNKEILNRENESRTALMFELNKSEEYRDNDVIASLKTKISEYEKLNTIKSISEPIFIAKAKRLIELDKKEGKSIVSIDETTIDVG